MIFKRSDLGGLLWLKHWLFYYQAEKKAGTFFWDSQLSSSPIDNGKMKTLKELTPSFNTNLISTTSNNFLFSSENEEPGCFKSICCHNAIVILCFS